MARHHLPIINAEGKVMQEIITCPYCGSLVDITEEKCCPLCGTVIN